MSVDKTCWKPDSRTPITETGPRDQGGSQPLRQQQPERRRPLHGERSGLHRGQRCPVQRDGQGDVCPIISLHICFLIHAVLLGCIFRLKFDASGAGGWEFQEQGGWIWAKKVVKKPAVQRTQTCCTVLQLVWWLCTYCALPISGEPNGLGAVAKLLVPLLFPSCAGE